MSKVLIGDSVSAGYDYSGINPSSGATATDILNQSGVTAPNVVSTATDGSGTTDTGASLSTNNGNGSESVQNQPLDLNIPDTATTTTDSSSSGSSSSLIWILGAVALYFVFNKKKR